MTIGEVAHYFKVTGKTIYRLVGAKRIPAFEVEGSWWFSKVESERWIQQQSASALQKDSD
jgi:excisionase family DNA binding protein